MGEFCLDLESDYRCGGHSEYLRFIFAFLPVSGNHWPHQSLCRIALNARAFAR